MNGAVKSLQLFLGILIGLIGLGAIAGGFGYYFFITQMSTHPPKPVFAEERAANKAIAKAKTKPKVKLSSKPTPPSPSPVAQDPDDSNVVKPLAPDAYDAKVIWKDGLSLKQEPDPNSEKVGGVAFNAKVAIIETSDDKQWVKIQSETDNLQGWVRAGNIDKAAAAINNDATPAEPKPQLKAKPKPRTEE